jgi:hypothetical protein
VFTESHGAALNIVFATSTFVFPTLACRLTVSHSARYGGHCLLHANGEYDGASRVTTGR